MKIKNLFYIAMATMALASCSEDIDIANGNTPGNNDNAQAYMALTVDMLNSKGVTRASTSAPGTQAETKISKALVVFLDAADKITSTEELTAPSSAIASEPFEVIGAPVNLIVIANYTDEIEAACKAAEATLTDLKVVFDNANIDAIASEGNFLMTTLNKVSCTGHIKKVSPAAGDYHSITAAKSAAVSDPAIAIVDRVVSKVTLASAITTPNTKGATIAITKWGLDVMNTQFYLMPEKEVSVTSSAYYKDPNYDNNAEGILSQFSRIAVTGLSEFTTGNSKYCLENTMTAKQQVNGYTTQALIQVEYTPQSFDKGKSWFRFRGKAYQNLSDLQTVYAEAKAAGGNVLTTACDDFFKAVKGEVPVADFEALTIEKLDEIADGGSMSKAIEYYQKGICYYPILIRHDDVITAPMALGKWGVVRNNWYNLTINSISEPGTPWVETPGIDDPTTGGDDPSNEDIENADDIIKSYISVTITAKEWTKWEQIVDL